VHIVIRLVAALGFVSAGLAAGPLVPPAHAAETYVCWVTEVADGPGTSRSGIRCRIAGSAIRDFTRENPPPVVLVPAVGTDADGGCWYRGSWWSGWTMVARYPDGSARLRLDPDGIPGGLTIADAVLPGCRSEPTNAPPDVEFAWRLLNAMDLSPGIVSVVPERPVSGLMTYLQVEVSSKLGSTLVSPVTGHRIEVQARAADVIVDWGDFTEPVRHKAADPALASELGDAALFHVYEFETDTRIAVLLAWDVGWRVDQGPWRALSVEPVRAHLPVSVDQIVGRLVKPGMAGG